MTASLSCSAPQNTMRCLIFPEDEEDLALTLDGKKKHINRQSFVRAMASSGLGDKVIEKIFRKFMDAASKWYDFIDASFLPVELKEKYKEEIRVNLGKLRKNANN